MKKSLFLILNLLSIFSIVHAEDYYTVFRVSSNICTPVTLKTPYGTYELTTEIRIPHSLSWFEAYDCDGNKLMNPGGSFSVGTNQATVRTYTFSSLFPNSNQSETSESASSSWHLEIVDDEMMYNDIAINMRRPFVLLFYREYDSNCNHMIELLNSIATDYPSIDFFIADIDANPLMRQRCQVYSVPFTAMTCTPNARFYKGFGVMNEFSLRNLIEKGIRKWNKETR
mgnify:CR=1 FL=1